MLNDKLNNMKDHVEEGTENFTKLWSGLLSNLFVFAFFIYSFYLSFNVAFIYVFTRGSQLSGNQSVSYGHFLNVSFMRSNFVLKGSLDENATNLILDWNIKIRSKMLFLLFAVLW